MPLLSNIKENFHNLILAQILFFYSTNSLDLKTRLTVCTKKIKIKKTTLQSHENTVAFSEQG